MVERQLWRYFDWSLMLAVLALGLLGVAMVYSATFTTPDLRDYWIRQAVFLSVGVVILIVVALFDYRNFELLALPSFLLLIISLAAVLVIGEVQGGTRGWLSIGGILVQPAEAGKFLLVIFFAWYLSWYYERMAQLSYLLLALILLVAPLFLLFRQPDLGMTVTFAFVGGLMILVGGIRLWQVIFLGGAGIVSLVLLWGALLNSLEDYMLTRIQVFLDPNSNRGAAYDIEQAKIAIGAGGWLGQGWTYGSQNQLHFLRVRHTDFIFSITAEELGLIGATLVIFLSFYIVWRLLRIADLARDQFGRLLAVGVAAIVFFQVFINIGMNLSLLPVTGLTLPFVSYGGSSLISMMAAIGLAQSVSMRHRKMDFQY
jgi:rod shape determining protein RodA